MSESNIWESVLFEINANGKAVLTIVVESTGSVPGVQGTKAVIGKQGLVTGTIGGGIAEHTIVEKSKQKIKQDDVTVELVHMSHDSEAEDSSGMICSGSQHFAIIPLAEKDKETLVKIIKLLQETDIFQISLSENGVQCNQFSIKKPQDKFRFSKSSSKIWGYHEILGIKDTLYIVGGGHVSLALSRIMHNLGFNIIILDDRKDVPTMKSNVFADEKKVISYDKVSEHVHDGEDNYVAIMTFGHESDQEVLEALIHKELKYIGLMASPHKKEQLFHYLKQKGISEELLSKVKCPIGLPINSHTPEDIAVSIAAEIIQTRNKDIK